jgi:hypothetical protein
MYVMHLLESNVNQSLLLQISNNVFIIILHLRINNLRGTVRGYFPVCTLYLYNYHRRFGFQQTDAVKDKLTYCIYFIT